MTDYQGVEHRGQDTATCHTDHLPPLSFAKLQEARQNADDPRSAVHALGRFATLVFEEREHRPPELQDTIALRDNDDLALAAMFELEHPDINGQVRTALHSLGVIAPGEMGQPAL